MSDNYQQDATEDGQSTTRGVDCESLAVPQINGFVSDSNDPSTEEPGGPSAAGKDQAERGSSTETEDALRQQLRREREMRVKSVAHKLEASLEVIKGIAKTMLTEVDAYMKTSEQVQYEYDKVHAIQHVEAQHLTSVESDVTGATGQFFDEADSNRMGGTETRMG